MKPIIGITSYNLNKTKDIIGLSEDYLIAIEKSNGLPLVLPINLNRNIIKEFVSLVDGLLLSGGSKFSINKKDLLSGKLPNLEKQDPIRYNFEEELIKFALKKNMPLLGICRGNQMIGEFFGAKLFLNLYKRKNHLEHFQWKKRFQPVHYVSINPNTIIGDIFKKNRVKVNSTHRQGLIKVPSSLKIAAISDDGVIEAIESRNHNFVLGIQFHAERLIAEYPIFQKIFDKFVEASIKYKKSKTRE